MAQPIPLNRLVLKIGAFECTLSACLLKNLNWAVVYLKLKLILARFRVDFPGLTQQF